MEILDLYDDNFNLLNQTIIRGEEPEKGKNIMISLAYIKDRNGNYLIQKTSKSRGSKFSTTGGHVQHGENTKTAVIRELQEELGIKVKDNEIKYIISWKHPYKQHLFDIYLLEDVDIDIKDLKLQEEEVESVKWMKTTEVEKIINENSFLESHAYIFNNYIK